MKGSISIGCDICREFLGFDGMAHPLLTLEVRSFQSIAEAEKAAIEAGWTIREEPLDDAPLVTCTRCKNMLSVMCCGCLRLLGKNNELIGEKSTDGGAINIAGLIVHLRNLRGKCVEFFDKQKADEAALAAGWTVKDPDGTPNHRCPECKLPDSWGSHIGRSGAYIEWPD